MDDRYFLSKEVLSTSVSEMLDNLGYSLIRKWERIITSRKWSLAKAASTKQILKREDIEKVCVGSKAEGIGLYIGDSDLDCLQIYHSVWCLEKHRNVANEHRTVFKLDRSSSPAGYAMLQLVHQGHKDTIGDIQYALVLRNGKYYLSSGKIMSKNIDVFANSKGIIGRNTVYKSRRGPAIQKYVKKGAFASFLYRTFINIRDNDNMDIVQAFPCDCNSLLQEWKLRERKYDWPTMACIEQILLLPTHVVPVGKKGSKTVSLQWRISFTFAEICLVKYLNDTQTKLLVMLRLIAKHILQPEYQKITSFVVKNVIFWVAENYPLCDFSSELLYIRLENTLEFLTETIENESLKHYFLPARNLFAGKFKKNEQKDLIKQLKDLLQNGPTLLNALFKKEEPQHVLQMIYTLDTCNSLDIAYCCYTAYFTQKQLEIDDFKAYYDNSYFEKRNIYHYLKLIFLIYLYSFDKELYMDYNHIPDDNDEIYEFPKIPLIKMEAPLIIHKKIENALEADPYTTYIYDKHMNDFILNSSLYKHVLIQLLFIFVGLFTGTSTQEGIFVNLIITFIFIVLFIIAYQNSCSQCSWTEDRIIKSQIISNIGYISGHLAFCCRAFVICKILYELYKSFTFMVISLYAMCIVQLVLREHLRNSTQHNMFFNNTKKKL